MKLNKNKLAKLHNRIFFILLLFFSIIMFSYLFLDNYMSSNKLHNMLIDNAISKIEKKESNLNKFLDKAKEEIYAIKENKIFIDYLNSNNNLYIKDLFLSLVKSNAQIMQLRYIDNKGNEKVKIIRDHKNIVKVLDDSLLQIKYNRDYFIESISKPLNRIWFSQVDLNIENGKVEIPFKSTLRVILPLEKNGNFDGILVINYFMNDFLSDLKQDNLYNTILVDEEGYTLFLSNDKEKSWGKYRKKQIKIYDLNKMYHKDLLKSDFMINDKFVLKKIKTQISGKLYFIFELNNRYLEEEKRNQFLSKVYFSSMIFILLSCVLYFVAKILNTIMIKLDKYDEYVNIIDENIITSTTDLNGRIIYASKAFCKISGYKESELLGKRHNIIRHPSEDKKKYKELWKTLLKNETWEGELKNKKKNGEEYWVYAKIFPIFNNEKKIGYTAIREDITDKKIIEKISITDSLTQLYNRKYFDDIVPKILNTAKRNNQNITFVMIDIDFFKQYNDTYGHKKGDEVLKKISKEFKNFLKRSEDYIFRIGGEEFALILSNKSLKLSIEYCEKLRIDVENLKIEHTSSTVNKYVTISMGVVTLNSSLVKSYEELYSLSDKFLYKAKENGRNKVESNSNEKLKQ